MDALTTTKPGVFVLAIKTIHALFLLTNQPLPKFSTKLASQLTISVTTISVIPDPLTVDYRKTTATVSVLCIVWGRPSPDSPGSSLISPGASVSRSDAAVTERWKTTSSLRRFSVLRK